MIKYEVDRMKVILTKNAKIVNKKNHNNSDVKKELLFGTK